MEVTQEEENQFDFYFIFFLVFFHIIQAFVESTDLWTCLIFKDEYSVWVFVANFGSFTEMWISVQSDVPIKYVALWCNPSQWFGHNILESQRVRIYS